MTARPSRIAAVAAVAAVLVLGTAGASAATVFSREGWGWWLDGVDVAARGRGGTGAAVSGYGVSGAANPAVTALSPLTYGYGDYLGEVTSVRGASGSYRQRSDMLPAFGGVFVLPRGLRALALLRAQTDGAYTRTQELLTGGQETYTLTTTGSGGWNRLEVGLSGPALERHLLWGATVGRIMGSVKEEYRYVFADPSSQEIREIVEGRLAGGWIGSAGAVVRSGARLSLAGSAALGSSSGLTQESHAVVGGAYDELERGRQSFPGQWSLGVRALASPRFAASGDYVRTLWGSAGFRAAPGEPETKPFRNTTRWGAGIEVAPSPLDVWPSWILRAGYERAESYVPAGPNGADVAVERAATVGMRISMGQGRAAFDVAAEIGTRGDQSTLGVEERFVRLSLGIAFSSVKREY